jgi:hypothetical protein
MRSISTALLWSVTGCTRSLHRREPTRAASHPLHCALGRLCRARSKQGDRPRPDRALLVPMVPGAAAGRAAPARETDRACRARLAYLVAIVALLRSGIQADGAVIQQPRLGRDHGALLPPPLGHRRRRPRLARHRGIHESRTAYRRADACHSWCRRPGDAAGKFGREAGAVPWALSADLGHFPQREAPKEVARRILDFIAGHDRDMRPLKAAS